MIVFENHFHAKGIEGKVQKLKADRAKNTEQKDRKLARRNGVI